MTLNEFRYIVAVARERHFGRAAEACHVSQPTLSVAVKKLEEELGVGLFERGQGEVTVTPAGEPIVAQAQRVLEEVEGLKQLARQGSDPLVGPLRIGAIYTIGPYLFPQLVPALARSAPQMPLLIEENYTAVLAERLKRGELDVIVISLPFTLSGVLTRPLYDEPFVALLPADHPLAEGRQVERRELARQQLLLLGAGHCFRDQVLDYCPECQPHSADGQAQLVEGSSLETIRYMVASGIGVTVLPCSAAGSERFSEPLLAVRPFAGQPPQRTVALAWRRSFPRPQVIDVLARTVAEVLPECASAHPL